MRKIGKEEFMERVNNVMDKSKEKTMEEEDKNNLIGLNTILFQQLNELSNKNLSVDELKKELDRSKAIVNISQTIINNSKLLLEAEKHYNHKSKQVQEVLASGENI